MKCFSFYISAKSSFSRVTSLQTSNAGHRPINPMRSDYRICELIVKFNNHELYNSSPSMFCRTAGLWLPNIPFLTIIGPFLKVSISFLPGLEVSKKKWGDGSSLPRLSTGGGVQIEIFPAALDTTKKKWGDTVPPPSPHSSTISTNKW